MADGRLSFEPIGVIESGAKYRYELPRQPIFTESKAFLRWNKNIYAECAEDLKGFDRIWLIWVFDRNSDGKWHSKVQVPVPAEKNSYSVFATRSPYRPNPIGISAVELIEITPEGLFIGSCDLLDGTPVLDVKPYIPEVDAFPEVKAGWRDNIEKNPFVINWTSGAVERSDFIMQNGNYDLQNFCTTQLSYRPTDSKRKRVEKLDGENLYLLRYRTWKITFICNETSSNITILNIESNYSSEDLRPDAEDKYNDKELHRQFLVRYPG